MPKMKTRRAVKKRFKVTGSGKVTRKQANKHHKNEKKSSSRLNRLKGDTVASAPDQARVKKMLGI